MNLGSNNSRRNGKIEFYRFYFCIAVLLFHAGKYIIGEPSFNNGIDLSLFSHGAMSCEFFFLVSGFLMAKLIYKKQTAEENGNVITSEKKASEYIGFIRKKYLDIFPQHFVAFVLSFAILVIIKKFNFVGIIKFGLDSIPNLFLIQMTGVNFSNPNHVEWYISCMFIALLIVYPICRKWYYQFTRYFSWLSALLILGYIIHSGGCLTGVSAWEGICYRSVLRAIAEISLGTTAFEISRYISLKKWEGRNKALLTVFELLCFCGIVIYMILTFKREYEIYALAMIFVVVILGFSGVTYGANSFNNKICYFLGKISLPIYLAQLPAIYIVNAVFKDCMEYIKILLVVVGTFIFAAVVYFGGKGLKALFERNSSK